MYVLTCIAGRLNINKIHDLINCFNICGNYAYHFVPSKKLHFVHIMCLNNKIKNRPSNTPMFIVLAYCTGSMFRLIVKSSSGPYIYKISGSVFCIYGPEDDFKISRNMLPV